MTDRLDPLDLDRLWDFDDPETSVARFEHQVLLADPGSVAAAEWSTQLARAHGLAGRRATAEELLAGLDPFAEPVIRCRVALERGRLLNSAGAAEAAVPSFRSAVDLEGSETDLLVDALHMLAIADQDRAEQWTGDGLAAVAGSTDPRVRRWAGALRTNLGWTFADRGDPAAALQQFEAALEAHLAHGTPFQIHVAHWTIGRTLRDLGRVDEALAVQRGLADRDDPDPHVERELAELARTQGRSADAAEHEARAVALSG